MKNLVDVVGLHSRGDFRRFGDIAGEQDNVVRELANPFAIGVAVEKDQFLACDAFFAHQVAGQIRAEEASSAGNHYRHFRASLAVHDVRTIRRPNCENVQRLDLTKKILQEIATAPFIESEVTKWPRLLDHTPGLLPSPLGRGRPRYRYGGPGLHASMLGCCRSFSLASCWRPAPGFAISALSPRRSY